jgi:transaldolase
MLSKKRSHGGRKRSDDGARVAAAASDRLAVYVIAELLRLVPAFVSTEVDANLSFNFDHWSRGRAIVDAHKQRGVGREHLLISSHRRAVEYELQRS